MTINLNYVTDKIKDLKRSINSAIYGKWDIVDNESKETICSYDTFFGFEFSSSSTLPSYPIQNGSFRNYNKVNNPNNLRVSIAVSGNKSVLKTAIELLSKYNEGTQLVDVVTPFKTFISYNLTNMNYELKSGEAVSRLTIEFDIYEIRQSTVAFSNVSSPNFSNNVNGGKVQGQEIQNQSLIKNIFNKLIG